MKKPSGAILTLVVNQIDLGSTGFNDYPRQAHVGDSMRWFQWNHFRTIVAFTLPVAQAVGNGLSALLATT